MQHRLIAQTSQSDGTITLIVLFPLALFCLCILLLLAKQYRRCPPNRALVVYGVVAGDRAAKVVQSGGVLILPIVQDFAYLDLEPLKVDLVVQHAVTRDSGQTSITATYTVAIGTEEQLIESAAERLLGLQTEEITKQASDIIDAQFRRQAANLTVEQFQEERANVIDMIERHINADLNQIGLYIINTIVRELTTEPGAHSSTTRETI